MGVPILEERIGGLGVYPERSLRASIFSKKKSLPD